MLQLYIIGPSMPINDYVVKANIVRIGQELGVNPNVILASSHGRRSIDVLKDYDPSKATWDCMTQPYPFF